MQINDTISLLKECDAGTKMAVLSINEILDRVQNQKFKEMLVDFKDKHANIGNEIHIMLTQQDEEDKEPTPIAKGMSWVKTNMKMIVEESDRTVADLITDGCNMGVKSLSRYLNQYTSADEKSKNVCKELISIEENFVVSIRCFL
ncbi:MAG: hypothetical protein PHC91_09810 [Eubacteriales bacterium]|nr:hypothetical protein [Eubacteriales bacterium]